MYKINRRPKDDDSDEDNNKSLLGMDKLVDEMMNKVNVNGYNCEVFMERAVKKMGEKGILNPKEFGWKVVHNSSQNEYDEKAIDNDEKQNNNKENGKNDTLSQLINETNTEMCKFGHGDKWLNDGKRHKCIICGLKKDNKCCSNCWTYAYYDKEMDHDFSLYTYCSDCRSTNSDNIKKRIKMDGMISKIIRTELLKNPSLEMDLLCCMKRRAALDTIIYDINKLQWEKRQKWGLLVLDLDFLKAWNSCLGHVKADGLIKIIGGIMQSNINDINNGEWIDKNNEENSLLRGFVYRTGGDEFAIVIRCGGGAPYYPFGSFYNKMKKEINDLGKSVKDLLNFNQKDWKEVKEKLDKAKDRNNNSIDMSCVGVSSGLFVPDSDTKHKDWLTVADKIALEHAKEVYLPKKNGISIYYEKIGRLVRDKKVKKCLEKGVAWGRK